MAFSSLTIFSVLALITSFLYLTANEHSPSYSKYSAESNTFFASPPDSNLRRLKDEMFSSPKQVNLRKSVDHEVSQNNSVCRPCPTCLVQCSNRSESIEDRLSLIHLERIVNFVLHSVELTPGSIFIEMRSSSSGFKYLREFSQQMKKAPDTLNQASFSKLSDAFDSIFRKRLTSQAIIESNYGSCRVDAHANMFTDFFYALRSSLDTTALLRCFIGMFRLLSLLSVLWLSFEIFLCLWRRTQSFRGVFKSIILFGLSFILLIFFDSLLANYMYLVAKETATSMANRQLSDANVCARESISWISWISQRIGYANYPIQPI